VLVAVHGVGSNGRAFAEPLVAQANHYGWIVVAPTLRYGDWFNAEEVSQEDSAFAAWLVDYLDHLERERGVATQERVLLFGFSRGAGVLERFALLHPERVLATAALSSSIYTLPETSDVNGRPLAFPFGAADLASHGGHAFDARELQSIRWFVGVGGVDNQPKDVPQVWTPFIGPSRLDRARALSGSLHGTGAEVSLRIFPDTGHALTLAMRTEALGFLHSAEPVRLPPPAPATAPVPTRPSARPGVPALKGSVTTQHGAASPVPSVAATQTPPATVAQRTTSLTAEPKASTSRTADPVRNVEPTQSTGPGRNVEPTQPTELARSVEPSRTTGSTPNAEPVRSADSTPNAEPVRGAGSTPTNTEPVRGAEPSRNVEPSRAVEPSRTGEPAVRQESAARVEPAPGVEPQPNLEAAPLTVSSEPLPPLEEPAPLPPPVEEELPPPPLLPEL
jgi:predicted esterase